MELVIFLYVVGFLFTSGVLHQSKYLLDNNLNINQKYPATIIMSLVLWPIFIGKMCMAIIEK